MPDTYRVAQIVTSEDWSGRDGTPMRTQEVSLIGPDGTELPQTIKVHGKQEFRGLEQGQSIYGEIQNGKFSFRRQNGPQSAPQAASQPGRTDATGRSIERQVAAKIAGELIGHEGYAAMDEATFARTFWAVTNAVAGAIRGEDSDVPF